MWAASSRRWRAATCRTRPAASSTWMGGCRSLVCDRRRVLTSGPFDASYNPDRLLARARSRLTRLDPQEAWDAIQHGAILVDTRPEFQRRADGEIPGAIVVERNHLEWRLHPESDGRIAEAVGAAARSIVSWAPG